MLGLIVKMNVQEGKESEFEEVFKTLTESVRANEPGNHLYTLLKNDSGYYVLEIYEDQAALTAHSESEHFRANAPKFAGVLAGRPEIQQLEVVV